MIGPREIRSFRRLLEDEGVAMHDALWKLAYAAYVTLLSMDQKQFWQSAALQRLAARDLGNFWVMYQDWKC